MKSMNSFNVTQAVGKEVVPNYQHIFKELLGYLEHPKFITEERKCVVGTMLEYSSSGYGDYATEVPRYNYYNPIGKLSDGRYAVYMNKEIKFLNTLDDSSNKIDVMEFELPEKTSPMYKSLRAEYDNFLEQVKELISEAKKRPRFLEQNDFFYVDTPADDIWSGEPRSHRDPELKWTRLELLDNLEKLIAQIQTPEPLVKTKEGEPDKAYFLGEVLPGINAIYHKKGVRFDADSKWSDKERAMQLHSKALLEVGKTPWRSKELKIWKLLTSKFSL